MRRRANLVARATRCPRFVHPALKHKTNDNMLYSFFWIIPRRLNFVCQRFGTVCLSVRLFHLLRQVGTLLYLQRLWRWNRQSVPKRLHTKFRRRGITQKKEYNIQNTAKVWNQETITCRSIVHCRYINSNALRFTRIVFRLLYKLEYTEIITKKRKYLVHFHSNVDSYRSLKGALCFQ